MEAHAAAPERRVGQRRLAQEMTALVHGADAAADAAEAASAVLFGGDPARPTWPRCEMLAGELGVAELRHRAELAGGLAVDGCLVDTAAWPPRRATPGEALEAGEVRVNGRRVAGDDQVGAAELLHGRYLLVRRGKKRYALVRVGVVGVGLLQVDPPPLRRPHLGASVFGGADGASTGLTRRPPPDRLALRFKPHRCPPGVPIAGEATGLRAGRVPLRRTPASRRARVSDPSSARCSLKTE